MSKHVFKPETIRKLKQEHTELLQKISEFNSRFFVNEDKLKQAYKEFNGFNLMDMGFDFEYGVATYSMEIRDNVLYLDCGIDLYECEPDSTVYVNSGSVYDFLNLLKIDNDEVRILITSLNDYIENIKGMLELGHITKDNFNDLKEVAERTEYKLKMMLLDKEGVIC